VDRNTSVPHETSGRREPALAEQKSWDVGRRREWGYDVAVTTELRGMSITTERGKEFGPPPLRGGATHI
jgi:hypothetical protein